MKELNKKTQEAQSLCQRVSSLHNCFKSLDKDVETLERYRRDISINLTEYSEIAILIGSKRPADHPILITDKERDVRDIINLCEAIYTRRVEESLWGIKSNKDNLIKMLQE